MKKKSVQSTGFRTESDSMGKVQVPKDALYGAQTVRALHNFQISGRVAHPELITAYFQVKRAAAQVNADCKVLPLAESKLIQKSIDALTKEVSGVHFASYFPIDPYQAGAGTSQNMNVNEVIANFANQSEKKPLGGNSPIHPNDHVNRSQSTNDTYPTVMRLAILAASSSLVFELKKLSGVLGKQGKKWAKLKKSGRTHLQDAVPITLGDEFAAYSHTVLKCAAWVEQGRNELRELGIGGSAAGNGQNVPKAYPAGMVSELSALTGEKLRLSPNLCEAMESQSPVSFYSSMLKITALELTRICNDLRLLASGPMTGLAEIHLPDVQPGSSIMPGKVNPSMIEMLNQTCYSVLGFDQTVAYAVQAGQLELNVMMPIMAYSMIEATRVFAQAIRAFRELCVEGIAPNEERLLKYAHSTPQVATALSPTLGYERTAELVKESLKTGKTVVELVREKKLIPEAKLRQLIDLK
jgi:aspartate ammonia-lyase